MGIGSSKEETSHKIVSLESLRGLAALTVVLFHFTAFYPNIASAGLIHSSFETYVTQTPLFVLFNGAFAVLVFFVLSGFVLSYGFFHKGADLIASALKRYFRLMPVALVSVLVAFIGLKLGLFQNNEANIMVTNWQNSGINILQALWEGAAGIFMSVSEHTDPMLNPVLWTIYYELLGSILVYSFLALAGKDCRRKYIYALLLFAFSGTYFVGFIAGVIIADVYQNRKELISRLSHQPVFYKVSALIVAFYLASFPPFKDGNTLSALYQPLLFMNANYGMNRTILYTIASVIIIVLILTSTRLKKILEVRPLVYLGKISYSLYAIHYVLLGLVGSAVFLYFSKKLSYNMSVAMTFAIYIPIVLAVAHIIHKYVDEPSVRLSNHVAAVVKSMRQ